MFVEGAHVWIRRRVPGSDDKVFGSGVVRSVEKSKVILEDGSVWRTDGYLWASKAERTCGRAFCRRIELKAEYSGSLPASSRNRG
jgi:hypothetical protein